MTTGDLDRLRRSGGGLTDAAIGGIRDMIVGGRIKPGDRLPREADLAVQLGLSRNSLREAVRALALINILDVRQGDGTYVTELSPAVLLEGLNFIIDFHQDDSIIEFVRVRRMLEPEAAALAAINATEEQLDRLLTTMDESRPSDPPERLLQLDIEFHRVLGAAAGNTVLAGLLEGLSAPTNRARLLRGRTQEGAYERTLREHGAILDALRARDPSMAHAAMHMHVAGVETWLCSIDSLEALQAGLDASSSPLDTP